MTLKARLAMPVAPRSPGHPKGCFLAGLTGFEIFQPVEPDDFLDARSECRLRFSCFSAAGSLPSSRASRTFWAAVRAMNSVRAPSAAVGCPIHHDEHLAAGRRDLEVEAWKGLVTVDLICRPRPQVIDHRLGQLQRRHPRAPPHAACGAHR